MIKFSIKILGVNFDISILDNAKSDKISEGISMKKKSISRTGYTLFER